MPYKRRSDAVANRRRWWAHHVAESEARGVCILCGLPLKTRRHCAACASKINLYQRQLRLRRGRIAVDSEGMR